MVQMEEKLHIFNKEYPTDYGLKTPIIMELTEVIENNDLEPDMSEYELNLILDEALTNAMEHGNRWNTEKRINVEMYHLNHYLFIGIEDEGEGFDHSTMQDYFDEKDLLSSRGRGLRIISKLVTSEWDKSGSKINLKIHLRK